MPTFKYQSRDGAGTLKAKTLSMAKAILASRQITPLSIEQSSHTLRLGKHSNKRQQTFLASLSQFLEHHMDLGTALQLLTQSHDHHTQALSKKILARLNAGETFYSACQHYLSELPAWCLSAIDSGEQTAQLSETLKRIHQQLHSLNVSKKKLIKALSYPSMTLFTGLLSIIAFVQLSLPQIQSLYDDNGKALPGLTRCLVSFSHGLSQFGWALALAIFLMAICSAALYQKHYRIRYRVQALFLLCCKPYQTQVLSLLFHQVNTYLKSGFPIAEALAQCANTNTCLPISIRLLQVIDQLKAGQTLHQSIDSISHCPAIVKQLLFIGEQTASLAQSMETLAKLYSDTFTHDLETLQRYLEPGLMLFMAGLISVVMMAIYLPIVDLGKMI
ncbi:MAG: hypothetical protein COV52_04945 [Gammaproteobacteria bacterium CG11_big_fil_rev_8_21_14_0_20_46_22]|nr:MAG: hypothetical protein COW05_01390 [Gammaproteobacteria bacterium CG12_big_fil_rev_8_21_14_0_65_46_12]PIR11243.1 MAG: hypothetical protein COV52_04945 [Gammaproteobacteria bacterium CG11_big_fil_rev_8_21_14_0_20_46_22]